MPLQTLNILEANVGRMLMGLSVADFVAWSSAEIRRSMKTHVQRLAERFSIFVVRDITYITLFQAQAMYDLPPRHLSTLAISVDSRPLAADSTAGIERRDRNYLTTAASEARPVLRFYEDKQGDFNMVGFHPVPSAADGSGENAEVIFHQYPCEIDDGIEAPAVMTDYIELQVVGEMYGKESDRAMPEVAKACKALAELYEMQYKALYGSAQ